MLIIKICIALMAFKLTLSSDDETAVTNITLGLILGDVDADMHYRLYVPAFDIALETIHQRVREQKLLPMNITYVLAVTDNDCGQTVMRAPGVASTLYHTYQLDAIFGPNCSPEAAPVADLAAYWNIPMLTGSTTAHYLDQKSRYRTFTRLPFKQSTLSEFVFSIFDLYDWSAGAIIMDTSYIYWSFVTPAIVDRLSSGGIDVLQIGLDVSDEQGHMQVLESLQNRRSKLPLVFKYLILYLRYLHNVKVCCNGNDTDKSLQKI